MCFHPYHGKSQLEIPRGVIIKPGETVVEFHISNIKVTQLSSDSDGKPVEWWRLLELAKEEIVLLAKACAEGAFPEEIKGFYGVNVFPGIIKRLGFTLIPIPKGFNRWWLGFWESLLRVVYYSNNSRKKAELKKTMDPYEVWISREELVRRYYQDTRAKV